jgi:DNA-binding transcriptional ArsR family regulator
MTAINWEKVARATIHKTRVGVLDCLAIDRGRAISPNELAFELQEPLGNVSYHVKELARDGLIRLVETIPRRGALEHYYALTDEASAA